MPWPTPQDYSEALQSPQISFHDPELKAGQVETDSLGLPRPISGRFAIVYKMVCGTRQWAVRCFQNEVVDQQQRYAAISDHLQKSRLPYTVGFEFLKEGILIRGQWYPILKMEWIAGQPLNLYVEKNLRNAQVLTHLASSWLTMTQALRRASLAHGDLQDGNVLVLGNELKLIDYDGMFVPALAGRASNESGHRNYQHPNRSAVDYGLYLDNFSDWVIYLSLVALAIDPSLWNKLKCGDECLLFRKDDFLPQRTTPTLAALSQHSDPRLRSLATILGSLLPLSPSQVPALSAGGVPGMAIPKPAAHVTPPVSLSGGSASWLSDHLQTAPMGSPSARIAAKTAQAAFLPAPQTRMPRTRTRPVPGPSWVLDFITPVGTHPAFQSSLVRPRLMTILLMVVIFTLPLLKDASLALLADSILVALLLSGLHRFYRRDPAVLERRRRRETLQQQRVILAGFERTIRANDAKIAYLRAEEVQEKARLDRQNEGLTLQEQREKQKAGADFKSKSEAILTRVTNLNRALQKRQTDYQARAARTSQQLAQLNQEQTAAIAAALQTAQHQFIESYLKEKQIGAADIPGIGRTMAANLAAQGYVTAKDVNGDVGNVLGIGSGKANALMAWRQSTQQDAERRKPTHLKKAQMEAITAKFEAQRKKIQASAEAAKIQFEANLLIWTQQNNAAQTQLSNDLTAAQTTFQTKTQAITTKYVPHYTQIRKQKAKLTRHYNKECAAIEGQTADLRKAITDQNGKIAKARQELTAYRSVTFGRFVRAFCLGQRRP